MYAICLIVGFVMWYFYYGLELFLNSAPMGHKFESKWLQPLNFLRVHIDSLSEEMSWIGPGGWKKRLEFCRERCKDWQTGHVNEEDSLRIAKTLPGIFHFALTHIAIPFGPLCVYLILKR